MIQQNIVFDLGHMEQDGAAIAAPPQSMPSPSATNRGHREEKRESAISSFLRAQTQRKPITHDLQVSHHTVSTLGSGLDDDDLSGSWGAEDDNESFAGSMDNDDPLETLGYDTAKDQLVDDAVQYFLNEDLNLSAPNSSRAIIDEAIRISSDQAVEDGDEVGSCCSYDRGWYEVVETVRFDDDNDSIINLNDSGIQSTSLAGFHSTSSDISVASLDRAFQKLNACMAKTDESRMKVLQLKDATGAMSTSAIIRDDQSISSFDTRSYSSKESLGHKARKSSYQKPRRQRRKPRSKGKKTPSLASKTGVALRPSHLALL